MIIQHLEESIKTKQVELQKRLLELTVQLNQNQANEHQLDAVNDLKQQTEDELQRLTETLKLISN